MRHEWMFPDEATSHLMSTSAERDYEEKDDFLRFIDFVIRNDKFWLDMWHEDAIYDQWC